MDDLLQQLNAAQRHAVTSPAKVVQVLAPPGSGKTKTLTGRVGYLISKRQYKPQNLIVCTFTIKAAREMKERLEGLVGESTRDQLQLGTFHSVARRYLALYGHHIGIPKNFGVADTNDTEATIKRLIKRHKYNIEPSVAKGRISGLKARCVSPEQYRAKIRKVEDAEFAALYQDYEDSLRQSKLLDFDDLLLRCMDLLRGFPRLVSNVEAVLIDEFQDTNKVQFSLMELFSQTCQEVTVVGDPDQSIYSFRSAEIENLDRMCRIFPDCVRVNLQDNYRSSQGILKAASEVIEQDLRRPQKKMEATHCPGEKPVLRRLDTAAVEGSWIVSEISRLHGLASPLLHYDDFAVLVRSSHLSRTVETALGVAGIPYRMVGGKRFFDRAEIRILLDYLRVVEKLDHKDALARILNTPRRRIGANTVQALLEHAEVERVSMWDLVQKAARGETKSLGKSAKPGSERGFGEFVNIINKARRCLLAEETSLVDLIEDLIKNIKLESYLRKEYEKSDDFEDRWENVKEFIALASDARIRIADELPSIEGVKQRDVTDAGYELTNFLGNVALSNEVDQEKGDKSLGKDELATPRVTISTIHAAKGLEWPVVFIPAVYNNSIPHSRSDDHDEERRLLYVGMTRAQCQLYLSCPSSSSFDTGSNRTTLSPFLQGNAMESFFERKGPHIKYDVVQDIAQILRRDCISEAKLISNKALVAREEDDQEPMDPNDKKVVFETPTTMTSDLEYVDQSIENFDCKRRRVGFATTSVSINHVTTMSSYSAASTHQPSFISAAARMVEIKEEEANQPPAQLRRVAPVASKSSKPLAKASKKAPSSGTSIASFFQKPTAASKETSPLEEMDVNSSIVANPDRRQNPSIITKIGRETASNLTFSNDEGGCNDAHLHASTAGNISNDTNSILVTTYGHQTLFNVNNITKKRVLGVKRSLHGWKMRGQQTSAEKDRAGI